MGTGFSHERMENIVRAQKMVRVMARRTISDPGETLRSIKKRAEKCEFNYYKWLSPLEV